MPFEWRSPFGYAVALFLQVADVSTVLYCATLLFAFFIGSCWLCIVFVNDVASDLSLMNFGNASDENNGNHSNSDERLMKRRFFNTVQYYSDVKQLSIYFHSQRFWIIEFCHLQTIRINSKCSRLRSYSFSCGLRLTLYAFKFFHS